MTADSTTPPPPDFHAVRADFPRATNVNGYLSDIKALSDLAHAHGAYIDLMNQLHEKGWISDPKNKAKSVFLTDEGMELAETYLARHLHTRTPRQRLRGALYSSAQGESAVGENLCHHRRIAAGLG